MKAENEATLLKECTEKEAALLKERMENETAHLKARTDKDNEAALIKARHDIERIKRKADVADELKLKFVKRKKDLKKKVIEIEVKQSIVEENRMLNDVEVERVLAYIRASLDPPPLSKLPPGILDPVILDEDQSLFSFVTSVANECNLGRHPPKSIVLDDARLLERTQVGWLPPESEPPPEIDKP